jgi:hypothetical protein
LKTLSSPINGSIPSITKDWEWLRVKAKIPVLGTAIVL